MTTPHFADAAIAEFDLLEPPAGGPAILVYDIETAPAKVFTWAAYDQNIIDIEEDWYVLSVAYRWVGAGARAARISSRSTRTPTSTPTRPMTAT